MTVKFKKYFMKNKHISEYRWHSRQKEHLFELNIFCYKEWTQGGLYDISYYAPTLIISS